ncbi:carbohydrate ABC transporter permease [Microbacterium sp. NPDC089698]|jgi:ABC-type glycerol-3-phosphate transport system permease component|uniref:carbohydrate ABC transporter permease n=1 Tax=unclassified Microbacterium TaxID=2609290 RepID=UPI0028176519|nr:carbohydrate ABC transporter permease [Microbacterium sp.]MDR2322066.1 carbohydrate ABC transporter permease [Microbacterium sp.]
MKRVRDVLGSVFLPSVTVALLWIWVIFNLAFVAWIGLQSLKTSKDIVQNPFGLPSSPQWQNYDTVWRVGQFAQAALNSVVITVLGAVLIVALAAPAAYALARSTRRIASPLIGFFAMGLSIPLQTLAVPIVVAKLGVSSFMVDWVTGWWDDRITLLVAEVVLSLPFAVFVLTGFFRSLPTEVEEAAEIDGARPVRLFRSVVLPLARPGIMTVFVLNVIGLWNSALLVMLIISDPSQRTLPVALLNLQSAMRYSADWGGLFAGIVILVYPMIVLYLWVGRRIVDGMTAGIGK